MESFATVARRCCDVALEEIDWAQLTSLQHRLVVLVETLSSAPLLLPRECHSLANLAQLARYSIQIKLSDTPYNCRHYGFRNSSVVEEALKIWKATVEMRKVSQAIKQYRQAEKLFTEWRLNRETGLRPSQKEVEQFLWLM